MEKDSKSTVKSSVRPQNKYLKPWKKGDPSPNPKGKAKGQRDYATIYREALIKLGTENNKTPEDIEMEMIANGVLLGRKGDYRFYKDVLDRLHGTAVQKTDMTTGGEKLPQPLIDLNALLNNNSPKEDSSTN